MKENQNIEFKQSWLDEYLKWIAGLANAEGGLLGTVVPIRLKKSGWKIFGSGSRAPMVITLLVKKSK